MRMWDVTQLGSELPEAHIVPLLSVYQQCRLLPGWQHGLKCGRTCHPQPLASTSAHPLTPISKHLCSATQGSSSTQKHKELPEGHNVLYAHAVREHCRPTGFHKSKHAQLSKERFPNNELWPVNIIKSVQESANLHFRK